MKKECPVLKKTTQNSKNHRSVGKQIEKSSMDTEHCSVIKWKSLFSFQGTGKHNSLLQNGFYKRYPNKTSER